MYRNIFKLLLRLLPALLILGLLAGCGGDDADETAPLLTVDPFTTPTNVTAQTLTGTRESGATVSLSVDTTATVGPVSYPTSTTWRADISGLVEGANTVVVTAADSTENTTSVSFVIVVDLTAAVTLDPVPALINQTSLTVTGTKESGATIAVAVSPQGTAAVSADPAATTWSAVLSGLAEGTNAITVTATDSLGNVNTLEPVNVVVDITPPQVTANQPSAGAVIVSPAIISATFSEPIDETSLVTSSFVLRDSLGNVMGGSLLYIDEDKMLFLHLASQGIVLPAGVYTATVSTEVRDLSGNPMAAPYVWSFTVQ